MNKHVQLNDDTFLEGVNAARIMLSRIGRAVKEQIEEEGDFNIPIIAGIVAAFLPESSSALQAEHGFCLVLGEYLANCADGCVLNCDFDPACLDTESGVTK